MEWSVYNNMEGHYEMTEDFYFVHTLTKLDSDRRVQTRRGWAVDVETFNIYYTEGI